VRTQDSEELTLDTWTALLAGSAPWSGDEPRKDAWNRLLMFGLFLVAATTIMILFATRDVGAPRSLVAVLVASGALGLLSVQAVLRIARLPLRPRGVWSNLAVRVVLLVTVWLAIYSVLPGWRALWSTPAAIALGLDVVVTCNEIGWRPRPLIWYRNFLFSGFHLGMIGALIATFVVANDTPSHLVLPIFVCMHAWAATAVMTLWVVGTLQAADTDDRERSVREVLDGERRRRAHWLHDDVCAQLRLVSLTLQTNQTANDEVVALLDDFDHQLRLRQLDELLGTERVKVAEVLQPFIRHAQNQGIRIEGVPAFELAAITMPQDTARLAARAASLLTSNALNAGATAIAYEVGGDNRFLTSPSPTTAPASPSTTFPTVAACGPSCRTCGPVASRFAHGRPAAASSRPPSPITNGALMASILLVDDAAALAELFGRAIESELGHTVHTVVALAEVATAVAAVGTIDLALVDLSFPQERGTGIEALVRVHQHSAATKLAIITQGDEWVAEILRDAWELLPITTVISKSAPLQYQLDAIAQVLSTGSAPPDPAIQPLLPTTRNPLRTPERFSRLVQHAGHAKLWTSLLAVDDATYKAIADHSGLKLNTLKNYRTQLVDELADHGLHDPSLREMQRFALRCWPFLQPSVDAAMAGRR
jgi:CheY-like chemotaxis protein